jgi:peptide-methionine (S)-S-oxide reductase
MSHTLARSAAVFGAAGLTAFLLVSRGGSGTASAAAADFPSATVDASATSDSGQQTAVLAGGCFWGMQLVFEHVKGVTNVEAGYAGGSSTDVDYEQVSTGTTGNAESVRITYDPSQVTYGQLLKVFFAVAHDPTELNRQGPDVGTQYRSAIFYSTPEQEHIAKAYIEQLTEAKAFKRPIVTQVAPLHGFELAEAYHQDYAVKNPNSMYIMVNDRPKVGRLRDKLPELYREKAVAYTRVAASR